MSGKNLTRLGLLCCDVKDLEVISSMVQDAIIPICDMIYLRNEQTFILVLNRFCWESLGKNNGGERIHSGLRFSKVNRVQYKNIDKSDIKKFLSILSIIYDEGGVTIRFSGGGAVHLEVEKLNCILKDLNESWPTLWRPIHSKA